MKKLIIFISILIVIVLVGFWLQTLYLHFFTCVSTKQYCAKNPDMMCVYCKCCDKLGRSTKCSDCVGQAVGRCLAGECIPFEKNISSNSRVGSFN